MKTAWKDWKKSKKLLLWITAAAMALCLGACSDQASQDGNENKKVEASSDGGNEGKEESKKISGDLKEQARKTLDLLMEKVHNDTYLDMLISTKSIKECDEWQKLVSGDYSSPEKIYHVAFKEEFYNLLMNVAMEGDAAKINDLSENLKKDLEERISVSFITSLNSRKSVQAVALSNVITTGILYLRKGMAGESGMLIYCYKDAYPLVVNYRCNEDGIVSMTGNVIFYDDFEGNSKEEVRTSFMNFFPEEFQFLAGTGISVEEVR